MFSQCTGGGVHSAHTRLQLSVPAKTRTAPHRESGTRHPSQSCRQTTLPYISAMSHYPLWTRVRGLSVLQIYVLMQIGNVALIVETRAKLTRSEKLDQVFGIKDWHRTCSFSRLLKALSVVSSIICFTELPNILEGL